TPWRASKPCWTRRAWARRSAGTCAKRSRHRSSRPSSAPARAGRRLGSPPATMSIPTQRFAEMAELRFAHAINRALAECMEEDPAVFVFGEDVAEAGGPFGVTRGLHARFGPDRIRDTPISEAAMANAAVGAALSGLKPVLEIMFMDFMTLAMDALVNQAAKARFMFGGQASVPLVVRTPHGGGISAGPQHSQCLEAW